MLVNATVGSESHFLAAALIVKPPQPTFMMNASTTSLTLAPGSNVTDTIILTSLFGFSASLALGTSIEPFLASGPAVSLSLYTSLLSTNMNSTLTVSAPGKATLGSYNVTVFANGGGRFAFVVVRVDIVPLRPPGFLDFRWTRIVKSSKGGVESFFSGVSNPNKDVSIFLSITVYGVQSTGAESFMLSTGVIELGPHQTLLNIPLRDQFGPTDVGSIFFFSASILWGISPGSLQDTGSSGPGVPTSGIFTVVS